MPNPRFDLEQCADGSECESDIRRKEKRRALAASDRTDKGSAPVEAATAELGDIEELIVYWNVIGGPRETGDARFDSIRERLKH